MKRIFTFLYGATSYVVFLATFIYAMGFIGNFGVPKSLDTVASGPWQEALWVDLGLLSLFAVQHSVMARPVFKRLLTRVAPAAMERANGAAARLGLKRTTLQSRMRRYNIARLFQ